MNKKKSITELIKSLDLIISRYRSSFSHEEYLILKMVRGKLIEFESQLSSSSKLERRIFIQKVVIELLRLFSNPDLLNDIKRIF